MRVEAYTQVQQIYKSAKTEKAKQSAASTFSDQLEISSAGKEHQAAKQAVASAPDVREEVIAPLRKSILAGTYEVTGEQFAERMIQRYEEMR